MNLILYTDFSNIDEMEVAAEDGGDQANDAGDDNDYSDTWFNSEMAMLKPLDKLLSLKIPQESLKNHCRKQDLATGLKMNQQGDIFIV